MSLGTKCKRPPEGTPRLGPTVCLQCGRESQVLWLGRALGTRLLLAASAGRAALQKERKRQ